MLTDNLKYLTDEECSWREETVKASSRRSIFDFLRPRADWRLVVALDRLADFRSRALSTSSDPLDRELLEQSGRITELEGELAFYKSTTDNEQRAATDLVHCKRQLAEEKTNAVALAAEIETLRQRITELEQQQPYGLKLSNIGPHL